VSDRARTANHHAGESSLLRALGCAHLLLPTLRLEGIRRGHGDVHSYAKKNVAASALHHKRLTRSQEGKKSQASDGARASSFL